jgi:hypothetical protein
VFSVVASFQQVEMLEERKEDDVQVEILENGRRASASAECEGMRDRG